MKEIQFKSIEWKKSKISSLTYYQIALLKDHRNEIKFLPEIYSGNYLHLRTIQNSLEIPRTIF